MNSMPADERKFLELVSENRNRILRICRVYAWNSADQDDLYQEILLQIWRGLPALKEKAPSARVTEVPMKRIRKLIKQSIRVVSRPLPLSMKFRRTQQGYTIRNWYSRVIY